jgi:signal transduction histidine kinase
VILHNAGLTAELRARLRSLEGRSAEIRASRWRIVAAQDTERRELERDLHDGAQPGLTAVRLTLGLLSHLAARGDRDAVDKAFDQAQERISDALRGLRRILGGLDPQTLAGQGLGPALRERAEALGCAARFDISPELAAQRFDPAVESAVYYCCAEALQNTAKHAPDAPVTLSLTLDHATSRLRFTVSDEGPGFAPDRSERGAGLQNMSDRVNAVGGELELHSTPGTGTRITAWVPAVRVLPPAPRPAQAALSSPPAAPRERANAAQSANLGAAPRRDTT